MDFYNVVSCRRVFSKAIEYAGLKEFLSIPTNWKNHKGWDYTAIGQDSKGLILECVDGYYMNYKVKNNPQYSVLIKITSDASFHANIVTFKMQKDYKKYSKDVNTKRVVWFRDENDPSVNSYVNPSKAYPCGAKDWNNAKTFKDTPSWPEIPEGHDIDKQTKKVS